ncbi:hypothetical protein LguiB_004015 [Lonicera macranthoides]
MEASYEEFEPSSSWRHEQGRDTLEIHLPEFKKQQLRVQITNSGVLKISGERPVNEKTQRRFYEEYKVPKDCNTDAIQAKFASGILNVIMPKKSAQDPQRKRTLSQQFEDEKNLTTNATTHQEDRVTKTPTAQENRGNGKVEQTQNTTNLESSTANSTSKVRRFVKVAMRVAVAVALVSALGAYVMYKFKSTLVGEDSMLLDEDS